MLDVNKENLIWERPECAREGCTDKGFAQVGTKFLCGGCFVKYESKRVAMLKESTDAMIASL